MNGAGVMAAPSPNDEFNKHSFDHLNMQTSPNFTPQYYSGAGQQQQQRGPNMSPNPNPNAVQPPQLQLAIPTGPQQRAANVGNLHTAPPLPYPYNPPLGLNLHQGGGQHSPILGNNGPYSAHPNLNSQHPNNGPGNNWFMPSLYSPAPQSPYGAYGPPLSAQGPYGPMASPNSAGPSGRTVYVGNLPSDASVDELLNLVKFGPIENVKILPEKSCAFISFLDAQLASAFHADVLMRKVTLHGQELKIGWGKVQPVQPAILQAVAQHGASRNVYLGNLDEAITEQSLRDDLARFGPIDQVKIVRDQGIGFVHFLSIATAMKVVATLPIEPGWEHRRVNYGKDRCAYVPKNQHQQQQHNLAAAAMAANFTGGLASPVLGNGVMGMMDPNAGNRTVYLGNLHPETTVEEICNAIRGGILQQIRYIADKHICFVTFVDPNAALAFLATSVSNGVTIHSRRLKVGWGKHPGPPPPGIALVVQAGGSRNVYIGNLTDFENFDEERLRKDFGQYGEIELVNLLREKNCAFVNFTQISFAIKALEGMKSHPDYGVFKIAYGKDRCGNAPRGGFGLASPGPNFVNVPGPNGMNGMRPPPPRQRNSNSPIGDSPVDEYNVVPEGLVPPIEEEEEDLAGMVASVELDDATQTPVS